MLVDLARNDVGRVVEFGTCQVDELMTLERYSHVMHMTSQVSGALAEGRTPIDVLRATLPAGTVSGAPKVRAMEVIDELEPTTPGPLRGDRRLPGLLGQHRHRDRDPHDVRRPSRRDRGRRRGSVQAGAGVVADSVAEDEELETRNKAKALLCAIPAAEAMTAQRRRGRARRGRDAVALGRSPPRTTSLRLSETEGMTDVTADYLALRRERCSCAGRA